VKGIPPIVVVSFDVLMILSPAAGCGMAAVVVMHGCWWHGGVSCGG